MPMLPTPKADLLEVFSSIQGEGILVGCRQAFLRLPGCNLKCDYCDTQFANASNCKIETMPGSGKLDLVPNPIELEQIIAIINGWKAAMPGAHHSISITGGEPLIHGDLLAAWLPELTKVLPLYLETNGTLPDELLPLIDFFDWISMDIKLHSQTGIRTDWDTHRQFLQIAKQADCYVKLVVGEQTPDIELQLAADLVVTQGEDIPIILQPVTIDDQVGISTRSLLRMQAIVAEVSNNVRIIPQTHRYLGVL